MEIEVALRADAVLAEGPGWWEDELWWVDIEAGEVHRFDPSQGRDVVTNVGAEVGAAVPRRAGGALVALPHGFGLLDLGTGRLAMVSDTEADLPATRMNDGKCDPQGRFWAGSMAHDLSPGQGGLYRLDPDGTVTEVLSGVGLSNGLGWSPDGGTFFHIDTLTGGIDAYDFDGDTGSISAGRRLLDVRPGAGSPDGMTVDADGCLWVALWGGSAVHRYTPEGALDRVVEVPTRSPTSCCFGGSALDELYITTDGRPGPDGERDELAGSILRYRPGVQGLPLTPYDG